MTDTSIYPLVTGVLLLFFGLFHLALIFIHRKIVAPTNLRIDWVVTPTTLVMSTSLMLAISHFITFRVTQRQYDIPLDDQDNMFSLSAIGITLQLFAYLISYSTIYIIIGERVSALGLPKWAIGGLSILYEAFTLFALCMVGMLSIIYTAGVIGTHLRLLKSRESREIPPAGLRSYGAASVSLTILYVVFIIARAVNHIINLHRKNIRDSAWERLLYLISLLLLLHVGTIVVVYRLLLDFIDSRIGEITDPPHSPAQLNDPSFTDPRIRYLEIAYQLPFATETLIINSVLVWLFSKYSCHHWEWQVLRKMKGSANSGPSLPMEEIVEIPVADVA